MPNNMNLKNLLLGIALYLPPLSGLGAEPRYVNSRDILLSYQSVNKMPVAAVHLWVCAESDSRWTPAETASAGLNAVGYRAPQDGVYRFYMVLENAGGVSAPPPTEESAAQLEIVVDTKPPTLQIHRVMRPGAAADRPELRLFVTLVDENLGEAGTRIFYRANAQGGWVDAGLVKCELGSIEWALPAELPEMIDIRLIATDLAGNRAVDDILEVPVPRGTVPSEVVVAQADARDAIVVPLVEPVAVAPLKPVTLAENGEADVRNEAPADDLRKRREAEDLHRQASAFLAEGRYALAGARLQSALELDPDKPDMLVDLGSSYYRGDKFDLADAQYRRAAEIEPDNPQALEGLALVAATQKRYPDAREHLQHLLKLRPDAAEHWLHFGDVEHMLGDRTAARQAWDKALRLETADAFVRKEAKKRLDAFQAK
jgi:tetratricopeptide (TPR) repeat protein